MSWNCNFASFIFSGSWEVYVDFTESGIERGGDGSAHFHQKVKDIEKILWSLFVFSLYTKQSSLFLARKKRHGVKNI